MKGPPTSHVMVVGATVVAAVAVGAVLSTLGGTEQLTPAAIEAGQSVSAAPSPKLTPQVEAGSRKLLAQFPLRGRKLRLERANMSDGSECLLHAEIESGVSGSQCFRNGLFGSSKVAFTINSDGGPERFSSMYLVGAAHPAIGRLELVKSDGSTTQVDLTAGDAFVIESSPADLERDVFPAVVRVYGRGGRLVETVEIPGPR